MAKLAKLTYHKTDTEKSLCVGHDDRDFGWEEFKKDCEDSPPTCSVGKACAQPRKTS